MLDRKQRIKQRIRKTILITLALMVVLFMGVGYGLYDKLFSDKIIAHHLTPGENYTFTAVKAEHIAKTPNGIFFSLTNDDKDVIAVLCLTKRRAEALLLASKENPVDFFGQAMKLSSNGLDYLNKNYSKKANYIYQLFLAEKSAKKSDNYWDMLAVFVYIGTGLVYAFVAMITIYSALQRQKRLFKFFDENPIYNYQNTNRSVVVRSEEKSNIEVIKDHILVLGFAPKLINIKGCKNFSLAVSKKGFINKNVTLTFINKNGIRETHLLPYLTENNRKKLQRYLLILG